MTQLNTPYPATAYLTGFLRKHGYDCVQADPAIELVLRLFSREGLTRIAERLEKKPRKKAPESRTRISGESGALSRNDWPGDSISSGKGSVDRASDRVHASFCPRARALRAVDQLEEGMQDEGLQWAFGASAFRIARSIWQA